MTSWSQPHGGIGLPTQGSWGGACASWSWLPGTTHHLRGGKQVCRSRKSGGWNRKAAAPRASPPCGSRTQHPVPWGPAKPRLRLAAQLSVGSGRGRAPHPYIKQALSPLPGFPILSRYHRRWGIKKWNGMPANEEQRELSGQNVWPERREVMEKTVRVKLTSWDLILDEQREVVSTRLTRWGLGWRKLTLGAARGGGFELIWPGQGGPLGGGVSAPSTLTEWK